MEVNAGAAAIDVEEILRTPAGASVAPGVKRLMAYRNGYFVHEHSDGSFSVERGTSDVRADAAEGLSFEEAISYIRPLDGGA
ncbi:hypothetical protein ACVNS2_10490 [Paenibacillus caseinilyticus]|uniref:Uncharacterized protein n=1 Tax=Paenibacillus mucilaginosus K02 TaxID=997761 RepID=I0BFC3_9BACL|nr:hypothetical protein [Paenibacillus mucilaginosus]AFH61070.1 hypothetical protein B2K_10100 [Paenibacillus mucilaginosus K02]